MHIFTFIPQIYALCQKYNLMLIEDDPYWNLRFTNEVRSLLA